MLVFHRVGGEVNSSRYDGTDTKKPILNSAHRVIDGTAILPNGLEIGCKEEATVAASIEVIVGMVMGVQYWTGFFPGHAW